MTRKAETTPLRIFNIAQKGKPLVRVEADTVREGSSRLGFERKGEKVGGFTKRKGNVIGWWVEDSTFTPPWRCVEMGHHVARFPCDGPVESETNTNGGLRWLTFPFGEHPTARLYGSLKAWWVEQD